MLVILVCIVGLLGIAPLLFTFIRHNIATTIVYSACFIISLVLCISAVLSINQVPSRIILPIGLPWLGMHFYLDSLACVFLAIINFGAASASLYTLGYGQHETEPHRVLPFYPLFIAAMNLVVVAADVYSFLFAWELMSLASWALVMAHHHLVKTIYAGLVYLIMASFSAFILLFVFGLFASTASTFDDYTFEAIRTHSLSPELAVPILILTVIGAGSKAGLIPLHVWLPLAHPAAPSHVSALMSGVMTKVAIYAFIRITFDLMGNPAWWWSLPPLLLGGITAVIGVLYALMETDLKRMLAYSTIENIGIIFIAIGLALIFKASGYTNIAALALIASLFHSLNHMLFKTTLFFGAGAIVVATREQNMERLGGLIHRMPVSSVAFLIASMAISALPPLNGFASEWLIFQSILASPQLPQMGLKLLIPAMGVLLALTAAFAAACFIRTFGATYLGRARTEAAAKAVESDRWSLSGMLICAILCLVVGVFPGMILEWLQPVTTILVGGQISSQTNNSWVSITPMLESYNSYNGLLLLSFIVVSTSLAVIIIRYFTSRTVRKVPFWGCGYSNLGNMAQYSATSLAQPIRKVFATVVFSAHEQVEIPHPGSNHPAILHRFLQDPVWKFLYTPITNIISISATYLSRSQFLTIRRYLSFVFITLIILLVVLAIWG
ncbi:hydrogenase 4 subunit B [Candidatus Nitrosacidococcus tergens]|uniref:Putative [NiFe]-hydrogenase, membrane subunit HyfB n=1 Tax=Candidatus Nitrosacidococcus tergens TaxID=553981 RepID=A0A7G1QA73_9GAMM|nr:hydrogenase 4 subunit B [Candidatus Nitrosacidococcus tergens]CAB1276282.1 putative [NiFe]-hydrogenase, membrane subunit HyfB [Candidatus Nitrosacidococcus tergens]